MKAFLTFTAMAILLCIATATTLMAGWYSHELFGPKPEPIIIHDVPKSELPASFRSCIEVARACYMRERLAKVQKEAK